MTTNIFINTFFGHGSISKYYGCYRMVAESRGASKKAIASHIRRMNYQEYLRTDQWMLIARQVKKDANWQCEVCGSKKDLVVHHTTYEHLGYDMYHMEDLHCLCRHCHEKLHGIKNKRKNKNKREKGN